MSLPLIITPEAEADIAEADLGTSGNEPALAMISSFNWTRRSSASLQSQTERPKCIPGFGASCCDVSPTVSFTASIPIKLR